MKKIIATILVLITAVLLLNGCSATLDKAIIGEWHLSEESYDVDQRDYYPEVSILIFAEDGTWNNDTENTYLLNGNSITIDSGYWITQYTYSIEVSGNKLILQYPGCEPLVFEKAA